MSASGIGNASWLELVWTFAGLAGALNYWFLVLSAAGDRRFVRESKKNGVRRTVASMTYWTDVVLFSVLAGFAVVGLVAASQEPTNPHRVYTITSVVITILFCYGSLALNAVGFMRRRWRNHIYDIEERRDTAWNGAERRGTGAADDDRR